jgi:hypothetical protein
MNRSRLISRTLWLAAWGLWTWLGVGLYRELPRDIGPKFRDLGYQESERSIGFLHGENVVVSDFEMPDDPKVYFSLWNPNDGRRREQWTGPVQNFSRPVLTSLKHGVAVGDHSEKGGPSGRCLHAMDLRTGGWTKLGLKKAKPLSFHERQPWVAVVEENDVGKPPKLHVFDVKTGEALFDWQAPTPKKPRDVHVFGCWFVPESDEIVISAHLTPSGQAMDETPAIECWNVPRRERMSRVEQKQPFLSMSPPSRDGRVVFERAWGDWDRVEVMDCRTGAVVFSNRTEGKPVDPHVASAQGFQISPNGRSLVLAESMFDFERGRMQWKRQPSFEFLLERGSDAEFLVAEDWNPLLKEYWPNAPQVQPLYAVRDFETGRVKRRLWERGFRGDFVSTDGTLAVSREGAVFRMPPRVNWVLFLGCQAVLAAPLVLLWAFLRWRRKRKERLQRGLEA